MILSFVIPVYNVGSLLKTCLESISNISIDESDYEVIIVDDCSPIYAEESIIIEEYSKKQSNLLLLRHSHNKGLSASRNTGLKAAKGKYVWFVDSDDSINPYALNSLLDEVEQNTLDVVCFGYSMIDECHNIICTDIISEIIEAKYLNGRDFITNVPMHVMAWSAIFRRDYLQKRKLFFCEGILHEDQEFIPKAYFLADSIAYMPISAYNYLQRQGSIMKSVNPKKIKDLLIICDRLWTFAKENTTSNSREYFYFINRISFLFAQSLRNMALCGGYQDVGVIKYYPLSINKYLSLREKSQYRLINFNIRFYVLIKRIMFMF